MCVTVCGVYTQTLQAQTSKILNVKKEAVKSLRELNTLGEKKVTYCSLENME